MSAVADAVLSPREPGRLRAGVRVARRHPSLALALALVPLAFAALIALHRGAPTPPLARALALADLRASPQAAPVLARLHPSRTEVSGLDAHDEAVRLYAGGRLLFDAVLNDHGTVRFQADATRASSAYGSVIANRPLVLALMTALFVLAAAVVPLRRMRNLDVAAAASTVAAIVLLNAWTFERMVLASYPALLYLAVRCAWRALGPCRDPAPSVPLYDWLTARWRPERRRRLLGLIALALGLAVAMVGLSSTGVVDVGYAVMEGATKLVRGVIPYGHIADVFHGDTYPIGSYLLYVPFAWRWPVATQWDNADATLLVALAAALAVAAALRIALRGRRDGDTAGLRAAIAWLSFPPLLVTVSTGTTDVMLGLILLAALLLWRRPAGSAAMLAAGAWFKLIPLALLPLWLARLRGRSLARASLAVAAVSVPMLAVLLALGGHRALGAMLHALGYQTSRADPRSLWGQLASVPLQALAQAAALALLAGSALRIRRDRALAADRTRVAALFAAILLALQIAAGYWTYMYLVWVFPLLWLGLLAPEAERR